MASAMLQRLTIVVPTKEGRTARKELLTLYFLELLVSWDQYVTFLTALSQAAQHDSPLPGLACLPDHEDGITASTSSRAFSQGCVSPERCSLCWGEHVPVELEASEVLEESRSSESNPAEAC